jgi:DNA-binding MarR family transcriptional regulator
MKMWLAATVPRMGFLTGSTDAGRFWAGRSFGSIRPASASPDRRPEGTAVTDYLQAEQLQAFADEVFELSKESWLAQSRGKSKKQPDLSETEFLALDMLAKAGRSYTVGEIQRQVGVLPAQMSRIIRSLERKGAKPLVQCRINPTDKRKIDVELTAAGREAHRLYREVKLGAIQKSLEVLAERDREEFMRLLRLIRENSRKTLKTQ